MAIKGVNIQEQGQKFEELEGGKRRDPMANLSEAEKSEFRSFMDKVKSASEAGTLNAEELAASAPEGFKKMVEDKGGDIVTEITKMAEMKGPPPGKGMGPGPGQEPGSEYSDKQDETLRAVSELDGLQSGSASQLKKVGNDGDADLLNSFLFDEDDEEDDETI